MLTLGLTSTTKYVLFLSVLSFRDRVVLIADDKFVALIAIPLYARARFLPPRRCFRTKPRARICLFLAGSRSTVAISNTRHNIYIAVLSLWTLSHLIYWGAAL
jgi:hypothetical protein